MVALVLEFSSDSVDPIWRRANNYWWYSRMIPIESSDKLFIKSDWFAAGLSIDFHSEIVRQISGIEDAVQHNPIQLESSGNQVEPSPFGSMR